MSVSEAKIDVVYTWVDGAAPGYAELLGRYAQSGHDLNPNRYRDNLDLLKYSLRSLERYAARPDSGGPGRFRGGCGVEKGGVLMQAERAVISYCCDRARSVTWGIFGGLPSIPHGAWLNPGKTTERYLGVEQDITDAPCDRLGLRLN